MVTSCPVCLGIRESACVGQSLADSLWNGSFATAQSAAKCINAIQKLDCEVTHCKMCSFI